jgi:hypothetical protein
LVHANVAIPRAPLDHPMMAGFVSQVDEINDLAAQSPGFVAHPTPVDQGEAFNCIELINLSIWESVDSLNHFTHDGQHAVALQRRAEWFEQNDRTGYVLYWAPIGHFPTKAEVKQRLGHLKQHGPTPLAFAFERQFTVDEMLAIASEPVRP